MAEKVLYKGFKHDVVPQNYVFPPEARQKKLVTTQTIPVIDLSGDHRQVVKLILEAGKEFGIFQIVNHGLEDEVMSDIIRVAKEFFELPFEERAVHYSEDLYKPVRLFTSTGVHDIVRFWRDCLRMGIHPIDQFKQYWPENPPNLKESVERFAVGMKGLTSRMLGLIAEGLGLDEEYFKGDLSSEPLVSYFNFYPPCPDPTLTLGLAKHCDPGLITILLQSDISGLQILHGGEWLAVDPLPNAIAVNYGHQMEIVTNGLLKGVDHRAINNDKQSRLSIPTFIQPAKQTIVSPAPPLIEEQKSTPIYKPFLFSDYFANYVANLGDKEKAVEPFVMHSCA